MDICLEIIQCSSQYVDITNKQLITWMHVGRHLEKTAFQSTAYSTWLGRALFVWIQSLFWHDDCNDDDVVVVVVVVNDDDNDYGVVVAVAVAVDDDDYAVDDDDKNNDSNHNNNSNSNS